MLGHVRILALLIAGGALISPAQNTRLHTHTCSAGHAESPDETSPDRDCSSQVSRPRYPPPRRIAKDRGRLSENDQPHGSDWYRRHLQYGRWLRKDVRPEHEDERALPVSHR